MDNSDFELEDITNFQVMQIQCSRCSGERKRVMALIYHDQMVVDFENNIEKDVVAIFCQGKEGCDGQAWAFPVPPDNNIVQKHNALPTLTTDN